MRVNLPHDLGREEVRRRMRERSHEIATFFPGGIATVDTSWSDEDQMDLLITVLGKQVSGAVEVYDDHVTIAIDLPLSLSMMKGVLESAVRTEASKLLK